MIRLGSLAGYSFEGPRLLGGFTPPEKPAVYAILYLPEPAERPDRYAVIYVDHADNLAEVGLPFKHPRAHCWIERAGSKWKVHIATLEAPGAERPHRKMIAEELTAIYNPRCNTQQYDKAWRDEWIGQYTDTPTTGPLAPRGPDELPL